MSSGNKIHAVHFSTTPMAGGPMRMIKALNAYTNVEGRLIELQRNHSYESDLILSESPDECIEIVNKADIVNFHNYLDLESKEFYPIDFKDLAKKGKAFLIYYRTDPFFISGVTKKSVKQVLANPMPAIVNGQYPERYFGNARVVRNVMPDLKLSLAPSFEYDIVNISSKSKISANQSRWATKGYPEYLKVLSKSGLEKDFKIKNGDGLTYPDAMKFKSQGKVVLDDLVTGSYHMAGIEGLMLGKVTLAYLDERIEKVLKAITGSDHVPFVNTHLAELPSTVRDLMLKADEELLELGTNNRLWFEKFWNEKEIAEEYEEIYRLLLENPESLSRQKELTKDGLGKKYQVGELDKNHAKSLKLLPLTWQGVKFKVKQIIKKFIRRG